MQLKATAGQWLSKLTKGARTSTGKNVLLYMLFVAVAFFFWMLMSLDSEIQREFDVPLEITDIPDSITVISNVPVSLSVSVKGKGTQLVRYLWARSTPSLKLRFDSRHCVNSNFNYTRQQLDARLRDYFGAGVQIVSCRPDSLHIAYTSRPGKRIKVAINADITPELQYIISGPITASTDSVTIYSNKPIPKTLTHVSTEPIVRSGLRDTTRYKVHIQPIAGMRTIPDMITITVPVEPLISKKRTVIVEPVNVPVGYYLILFPSKVEVSYLVPISEYQHESRINVYADYNAIRQGQARMPLMLSLGSTELRSITMDRDSVEYILEKVAR